MILGSRHAGLASHAVVSLSCHPPIAHCGFPEADVYATQSSSWHAVDRVGATGLFATQVTVGLKAALSGATARVLAPFGSMAAAATYCLHNARTADDFQEHERSQAAWHLIGVAAVLFGARHFPRRP